MNEVVKFTGGELSGLASLAGPAINGITRYLETLETSKTKRTEIQERTKSTVAELQGRQNAILSYLERRFNERGKLFDKYFCLIEKAIDLGDEALMQFAFETLSQVYMTNPADGVERTGSNFGMPNSDNMDW